MEPRAQCDRGKFIWAWREILENTPNLHIWQDTVEELIVENGEATGVMTCWGVTFHAKCIVLTAGTFLNGLMHIGHKQLAGGRMAEPASYHLTESITRQGITAGRMKTGTPVRIDGRSVHYDLMETQDGENDFHRFSFMSEPRKLKQLQCWTCFLPTKRYTRYYGKVCPTLPFQRTNPKHRTALLSQHRNQNRNLPPTSRNISFSWNPKEKPHRTLPERVLFFTAHGHTVGGIEESTRI